MGINPQGLPALGLAALINIVILFFFCKSIIKTLSYIKTENKALTNTIIWFILLPGVNLIVNFVVVFRLSEAISKELESRDYEAVKRPTFDYGIMYAVLSLGPLIALFPIPEDYAVVVAVVSFSQIFFFVQYWMKINWYKAVLEKDEQEDVAIDKEQ